MPYAGGGSPLRSALEARLRWYCPPDLVANGPDDGIDLTPESETPAAAVRVAWDPLRPGQAIPMIGERVYAEPCDDR